MDDEPAAAVEQAAEVENVPATLMYVMSTCQCSCGQGLNEALPFE